VLSTIIDDPELNDEIFAKDGLFEVTSLTISRIPPNEVRFELPTTNFAYILYSPKITALVSTTARSAIKYIVPKTIK
jgi:hypothetical protein